MAKAKTKAKKKPTPKKAPKSTKWKTVKVDWSEVEDVKHAMALELDVPPMDLEIEEDRGMSGFGDGTVYRVTTGRQGPEYMVAEDVDSAEKLAISIVLQDLKDSPEIFEQNFIQSHIDEDRLRRDLHSDVFNSNYERLKEDAERRPMEFLKANSLDVPEPTEAEMKKHAEAMSDDETPASEILGKLKSGDMDAEDKWIEMGEEPEVPEKEISDLCESETEEQLKDPVSYLEDIYGREDAVKKAIEIAGIDEQAAAEEAVSTDGAGHFLSGYDGHLHTGPGGIVYWRTN